MVTGQNEPDPDNYANNKAGHETEAGRILDGALAQVEDAGRLVFVHNLEFARLPVAHN